jgi:hypothetical protein
MAAIGRTDNPRSTKSGKPQTRLLMARPQKYSGAVSEYIQWKRTWQEEGRDSEETEEAQLNQLKLLIPEKTSKLTVEGFWSLMDKRYYNALSKSAVKFAIADVKGLNREDKGFLQEMKRKLNTHRRHMDMNNMGHHIPNNNMVKKHWVPLLRES